MDLNHKLFAFFCMTLTSLSLYANPDDVTVDLYGRLNLTTQLTDDVEVDGLELRSNESWFGIRGEGFINNAIKGIYQLEWEFQLSDEGDSQDNHIMSRNQFIGLEGHFGQFLLGRHDTPTKTSQARVDLFNHLEGDIDILFSSEIRADNIIQYTTPTWAGFTFKIAAVSVDGESRANDTSLTDATSFAVEWHNDNFYVAFANDIDVNGSQTANIRFTSQYNVGPWQIGLMYNEYDNGQGNDSDGFLLSTAYRKGTHTYKFQYGTSDELGLLNNEVINLGWDIKLATKTQIFFFYTSQTDDNTINGQPTEDQNWLGFGIEQKF